MLFSYLTVSILFLLSIAITCVHSNLTTDPPGPVAVFRSSIINEFNIEEKNRKDVEYYNSKPVVITCKSSGNNITWDIPVLNFAELADQEVITYKKNG